MTIKKMNILKMAIVASMFSTHFVMPNTTAQKNKEWLGNVIKATTAACVSLLGASYYYETIVYPHIIARAQKNGLGDAIAFNADFALRNPIAVLYFATPLFISAGCALIAHDYAKKIWEEQELEDEQELQEKEQQQE